MTTQLGCEKRAFVGASSDGGEDYRAIVKFIIEFLGERGIEVRSQHNGSLEPVKTFLKMVGDPTRTDDNSFRDTDCKWIEEDDLFIAEASHRSTGLGAEFHHARLKPRLGLPLTPILVVHQPGCYVSPMLKGISKSEEGYIWIRKYANPEELRGILLEFLARFG